LPGHETECQRHRRAEVRQREGGGLGGRLAGERGAGRGAVDGFYGGLVDSALTSYMELRDGFPALVV
jgi:hypothetical protein